MEIYDRIIYLRKEVLHKSQAEFGKLLGVSRDVISNIEQNRLKQPEKQEPIYRLICKVFDISDEWLRTGEGDMRPAKNDMELIMQRLASVQKDIHSTDAEQARLAEFRQKLASSILGLTDEACVLVLDLLDQMGYVKNEAK